ncbi:MAG: integrin alpha [Planctomycetota bacterium JB042]
MSRLGDLDHDGRADLLLRLRPVSPPSPSEVHVVSGATGASLLVKKGVLGSALSDVGDINNDGLIDFLIGKAGSVNQPWAAYAYSPTCGSLVKFGSACPNAAGFLPQITLLEGCATPGGEIRLTTAAGSITNSVAALVVGATPAAVPLPGCTFLVGPPLAVSFLPTLFGLLSLDVDTDASIGVGSVYVQVLYPEPGTPAGFAATEGIAITFE